MRKLGVAVVMSLFLIGFVMAGITTKAVYNNEENSSEGNKMNSNSNESDDENENEIEDENETDSEIQNKVRERSENKFTDEQIKKIFTTRNKIKTAAANGECPEKCTCMGSVTKCFLANGTREMTIFAGNSGNVIIQVKGINATTNITLYKSNDGKIYAVSKDNETIIIKMLPDQVREKIRERLARQLGNESIFLDENGTYQYQAEKKAKLFFIFPINVSVQAEINPETGEVLKLKNPWWSFLAQDDKEEQIVGASCGTVTPGMNNECCKNKEYDFWNETAAECQFNSSD